MPERQMYATMRVTPEQERSLLYHLQEIHLEPWICHYCKNAICASEKAWKPRLLLVCNDDGVHMAIVEIVCATCIPDVFKEDPHPDVFGGDYQDA